MKEALKQGLHICEQHNPHEMIPNCILLSNKMLKRRRALLLNYLIIF